MKFLDKWLYGKVRDMWDNRYKYEEGQKMNTLSAGLAVERSRAEGEGRITFELSTAVGGKILNVRHYDDRKDRHDSQTYVIPSGEDVGERVAKIINLELFKQ
jgi:S-adenosylhomocysteine hydrolase